MNEVKAALSEIVEKIRQSIKQEAVTETEIVAQQTDLDFINLIVPRENTALAHVLYMCKQIDEFIATDKLDKANRWIGFAQGVLWIYGVASIDESRKVNIDAAVHARAAAIFENGDPNGPEPSKDKSK
jgi:hypothetical protein